MQNRKLYLKKWRENNPKKVKEVIERWKKNNKKRVKEISKKYYENNKGKWKIYKLKRRQTASYKYERYRSNAKVRGYNFPITFNDFNFLISLACHYCGIKKKIGIDRRDNTQGYLKENCLPCCTECNLFKSTYKYKNFIRMCKKISKFQR